MWHFFPWRHGVCFQKGLRTSRVLHDMSSLRVHVVPMVCCQKVTQSVHDVLAKFLTYLTGLYLYTSQRVFSVGLTQIFEGVWLDCPEHNIRQIQNLSGTSVQAQFRAPRPRGSFQSVASRVWKGSICWRQEFAEPSSGLTSWDCPETPFARWRGHCQHGFVVKQFTIKITRNSQFRSWFSTLRILSYIRRCLWGLNHVRPLFKVSQFQTPELKMPHVTNH